MTSALPTDPLANMLALAGLTAPEALLDASATDGAPVDFAAILKGMPTGAEGLPEAMALTPDVLAAMVKSAGGALDAEGVEGLADGLPDTGDAADTVDPALLGAEVLQSLDKHPLLARFALTIADAEATPEIVDGETLPDTEIAIDATAPAKAGPETALSPVEMALQQIAPAVPTAAPAASRPVQRTATASTPLANAVKAPAATTAALVAAAPAANIATPPAGEATVETTADGDGSAAAPMTELAEAEADAAPEMALPDETVEEAATDTARRTPQQAAPQQAAPQQAAAPAAQPAKAVETAAAQPAAQATVAAQTKDRRTAGTVTQSAAPSAPQAAAPEAARVVDAAATGETAPTFEVETAAVDGPRLEARLDRSLEAPQIRVSVETAKPETVEAALPETTAGTSQPAAQAAPVQTAQPAQPAPVTQATVMARAPLVMTDPAWPESFVQEIAAFDIAGGEQIEMTLTPDRLGTLRVSLELRDGVASVSIVTDNAEAARMFNEQQGKLEELMQKSGLELSQHDAGRGQQGQRQAQTERSGSQTDSAAADDTETDPTPTRRSDARIDVIA